MADKNCDYETYCVFFLCCACLLPSIPVNLAWTFSGWLCAGYDSCGSVLPKQLPLWKRAIAPCEHAALENIPACGMNTPSPYVFFAPGFWIREAYHVLKHDKNQTQTTQSEPPQAAEPVPQLDIAKNPIDIEAWRSQISMS